LTDTATAGDRTPPELLDRTGGSRWSTPFFGPWFGSVEEISQVDYLLVTESSADS
jgi:hypothetical protein